MRRQAVVVRLLRDYCCLDCSMCIHAMYGHPFCLRARAHASPIMLKLRLPYSRPIFDGLLAGIHGASESDRIRQL